MKFLFLVLGVALLSHLSHADPLLVKNRVLQSGVTGNVPAAQAQVLIRSLNPRTGSLIAEKTVACDEQGVFETQIEVDRTSKRTIMAWPTGYILVKMPGHALMYKSFESSEGAAFNPERSITLNTAPEIQGTILDQGNYAVPNALVSALRFNVPFNVTPFNDEKRGLSTPWLQVRSDAQGKFSFPALHCEGFELKDFRGVVPLDLLATATLDGHVWKGSSESRSQGEDGTLLKLLVEPTQQVSGVVSSLVTHQPLANVNVSLSGSLYSQLDSIASVQTDAKGRWHIDNVPHTRVLVAHLQCEGFGDRVQTLDPQDGTSYQSEMPPLVLVSGSVLDEEGHVPPTPLTVTSVPSETSTWVPTQTMTVPVDESGHFSLRIPLGEQIIRVRGRGYREATPLMLDIPQEGIKDLKVQLRHEKH